MIKRAETMIRELKEQMRGGNGTVAITHLFSQDEIGGKARLIAKIELEPGCSIGFHEHQNEEEIFYIISGQATLDDQGDMQILNPGDAAITKGGQSHSLSNNGDSLLTVMAVILLYC
ncbi:MAG: cupin domain-containing protein [Clostridiaceae bacterium]|nr:cupin domain-containing protein [Clostridiaceae bacterium]